MSISDAATHAVSPTFSSAQTSVSNQESLAAFDPESRSTLVSRNVTVDNRRTSVRLEPEMWSGFNEICRRERLTIHDICTQIAASKKTADSKNRKTSLTAAIRVYIMNYYRVAATEDGHQRAGHGLGPALIGSKAAAMATALSASASAMQTMQKITGTGQPTTQRPTGYLRGW